ncbi:putative DEAD-box ATP-dependent RNA helicase 48 [Platanthera zijinensis]|uniref:DEAD-box ATP-dependent RNA helicase 48 n=1 Tax=Platanthera zijinensis TaxID=2320716 RepID=A0AAP0BSF3_9ASPA
MPAAGIFPGSLAILKTSNPSLSSCRAITGPDLFSPFSVSSFSLAASPAIIRMGGGPRTFPGGVSKWQWKRMQAKKAQQLLKARLCRERQLYEMRKRAELKAAISELERPWEVAERAPVLFSASADEQVKVLADRFQRPTGFDMWSERDGPQIFLSPDDLPPARFFPKGAVHSLKPYSVVSGKPPDDGGSSDEGDEEMRYDDWIARGAGGIGRGRRARKVLSDSSSSETITLDPGKSGDGDSGEHPISYNSDSEHLVAESMKTKKEMAELLNRHDRNHGLTTEADEMVPDLRLEGGNVAGGGFRRRGGREIRGGNRDSYRSQSLLPVACSRVKEDEISRGLDGRHGDSKIGRQKMPNGIDRLAGGGSRGGGNGNRGSEREGGKFGRRRGDHGQNGVFQFSNSKFGDAGSRMDDRRIDESFSRRGGNGGRRGRGGFQHSHRPYSADDDSRIGRGTAGDFGDRDGNHRRSRGPSSSDSDDSVARRRTEGDYIADGFVRHRGRGSQIGNRGVAMSEDVGRGGGRGGYRVSYRSASDLLIAGSRKARETGRDSRFGGSDQDYKGAARVSLRPTTDLRLEEGGYGRRD